MKTIQLTDEQYNALMQGEPVTIEPPKPKLEKWQPKGGEWFVNIRGRVRYMQTERETREFGVEYQTEQQAEKARDAMRTHNRLLAWFAENDDDGWVADWSKLEQSKYFVCFNFKLSRYESVFNGYSDYLGVVHMSRANAEKLAKLLNDGVVEL